MEVDAIQCEVQQTVGASQNVVVSFEEESSFLIKITALVVKVTCEMAKHGGFVVVGIGASNTSMNA